MLLVVALAPVGLSENPPAEDTFFTSAEWGLDLADLSKPELAAARGFSTLYVSPSGEVLIAGLDNGGILFLEAGTGDLIATAFTADHGKVTSVSSDHDGRRAVFVYEDGYVAAVDTDQEALLMSLFSASGAGRHAESVGAKISSDGQTLVVTSDRLQVYALEGESPDLTFAEGPEYQPALGPYLFLHPRLPYFAALDRDGTLGVFDLELKPQHPPVTLGDKASDIAALAVSHDGSAFAFLQDDGRLMRYAVRLTASAPELELTYEARLRCTIPTCDAPYGVALDTQGQRVMAWTNQELLWAQGDNENVPSEEAKKTDQANTVSLSVPVDGSWRFGHVAPDQELTRALLTQVDDEGATPVHHEFPSRSRSEDSLPGQSDPTGVVLEPREGRAFVTHDRSLGAFPVAPSPAVGPGGGIDAQSGGFWSTLFSPSMLWLSLTGVALVVLVAFFVAVLLVARRGDDARLVAELELEEGALAPPASARPSLPGGGSRAAVRPVSPSAPPEAPPPDGLLVLQDFAAAGVPSLQNLNLALARPGVVRVHGERPLLKRFVAALTTEVPVRGLASAGGADRAATPLLFARHLRVSLPQPDDPGCAPRAWYAETGRQRGVPTAVVKRRLEVDLGWMGARLDRPLRSLAPIDQWKVALAVAFLDRPRVLLLWTHELPGGEDPKERDTVRSVLAAVGRHYRAAVLLLDPGRPIPEAVVREWAHEELRLTPHGFRDRALLESGRPVTRDDPSPTPAPDGARRNGHAQPRRGKARAFPGSRTTRGK